MISTRGRYALRVMLDLAENDNGTYIPLKDIAERQEISKKYLEIIVKDLVKIPPRARAGRLYNRRNNRTHGRASGTCRLPC